MRPIVGREGDGSPRVHLAAFGKHPGWDDHMDDQGVQTDRLVAVKRVIYVEGIGGNIDSGAWEGLEESQRLPGFEHVFAWRRPEDVVVGRIWSSRDGKGRTKYPMIVCAQCVGLPLAWAIERVLPRLESVRERCRGAESAADVVAILKEERSALAALAAGQGDEDVEIVLSPETFSALASHPSVGSVGMQRIVYQISRELLSFRPLEPGTGLRSRTVDADAKHLRLPACAEGAGRSMEGWLRLLLEELDASSPILCLAPVDRDWVDVLVGEPTSSNLFCVRAAPGTLPLTTEIPYTIEEAFAAEVESRIEASQRGEGQRRVIRRGSRSGGGSSARAGALETARRVPKWAIMGAGAVVLLGLLLVVIWLLASGGKDPETTPPSGPVAPEGGPASEPVSASAPDADATPPVIEPTPEWSRLCRDYGTWFGPLAYQVRSGGPLRDLLVSQAWLGPIVEAIDRAVEAGVELDPRRIAGAPGVDYLVLARSPTREAGDDHGRQRTAEARGVVEGVRRRLETWPIVESMRSSSETLGQWGWTAAAQYLRSLSAGLARAMGEGDASTRGDLESAIERIDQARGDAEEVGGAIAAINPLLARIRAADEPTLSGIGDLVRGPDDAATGTGTIQDVREAALFLDRTREDLVRIADFVDGTWREVDRDRFSEALAKVGADDAPLDAARARRWMDLAGRYVRLDPDPRQGWDAPDRLEAIRGAIRQSLRPTGSPEAIVAADAHDDQARRAGALVDAALRIAPLESERAAVLEAMRRAEAAVVSLGASVNESITRYSGDIEQWFAGAANPISRSGSASVDRAWARRLKAAQSELGQTWQAQERLKVERSVLHEMEAKMPTELDAPGPAREWLAGLQAALIARREADLSAAIDALDWGSLGSDGVQRDWPAPVEGFARWVRGVSGLAGGLAGIERLLDEGFDIDESPGSGATIAERAAQIESSPLLEDPRIRAAIEPILARVDRLRSLRVQNDAGVLLERAGPGGDLGVSLAAWRRLGALDGAPTDLPAEAAARADLESRIASAIQDEPRRRRLAKEVNAVARRRWALAFAGADGDVAIERVLDLAGQMGVDAGGLGPAGRYDQLLRDLRGFDRGADDAQVVALVEAFVAAVRAMPVGDRGDVRALIEGAEQIAQDEPPPEPTLDVTREAGPALAGWAGRIEEDGAVVVYTWSRGTREHTLSFRLLEADGQVLTSPSFLLTDEVPLGVFADVIEAAGFSDRIAPALAGAESGADERAGPRVWRWRRGGEGSLRMVPERRWLLGESSRPDAYADGIDAGRPGRMFPMQQVSPRAALVVARLLGTRLATAAEWAAARRTLGDAMPADANLRDATFARQRDHMIQVERSGRIPIYPDAGSFRPAGEAVGGRGSDADALEMNDDVLWFDRVTFDGRWRHLVGNVAEYVYDDPESALAVGGAGAVSVQEVADLLAGPGADRLGVIGGSALSAPKLGTSVAWSVAPNAKGYSDVGFRLAFSARGVAPPRTPLAQRLESLLRESRYIRPDAP